MTAYFGEPWDVPMLDGATQVPTPVGVRCGYCAERVVDGEQGVIYPCAGAWEVAAMPYHRECSMAGIVGHMVGVCSCTGWEIGARATAREVMARVEAGALRRLAQ